MRISGITCVSQKTHKIRCVLTAVLVLFLTSATALSAISAYAAWKLLHPVKTNLEPFSTNIVPEYKDVSFVSRDKDITLSGWFFERKGGRGTVILAHSHGKNRLEFGEKTIDIIKRLIAENYGVLAFDMRNSGKSKGKTSTFGYLEKDDILGAVDYAKLHGRGQIVLMGFSDGASASIMAAAETNDAAAVIADSPYADLDSYLTENLSLRTNLPAFPFNRTICYSLKLLAGIDTKASSPLKLISAVSPRPLLLIHGKDDTLIPPENSRELYTAYFKASGKNPAICEFEAAGHLESYTKRPKEYMDRVIEFLGSLKD